MSAPLIFLFIHLSTLVLFGDSPARQTEASKADPEVRVLSAVGMRQVIADLEPTFERATGHKLNVSFGSGAAIVKRLEEGERADVVMLPRSGIDRLAGGGKLMAGSVADLATSHVGAAVRDGAPEPDISTPEAFKRAMLAAKTIACPDPALGGSSGVHIDRIFEQLGVVEALKSKLMLVSTPDHAEMMPGHLVARGEAEIALHQMQELLAVPGIKVIGPLPGDLQGKFLFSAAVMADAADAKAAKAFVEFLITPEATVVIKAKGMEPAKPDQGE